MVSGIINIVLGGVFIAFGASGEFALLGTTASWPLVVLGAGAVGFGGYQIFRSRRAK